MTTIAIRWTRQAQAATMLDYVLSGVPDERCEGTLSDEHAASSRGLPVVVDASGSALGPADLGMEIIADGSALTAEGRDLMERAALAGYRALVVTPEAFAR